MGLLSTRLSPRNARGCVSFTTRISATCPSRRSLLLQELHHRLWLWQRICQERGKICIICIIISSNWQKSQISNEKLQFAENRAISSGRASNISRFLHVYVGFSLFEGSLMLLFKSRFSCNHKLPLVSLLFRGKSTTSKLCQLSYFRKVNNELTRLANKFNLYILWGQLIKLQFWKSLSFCTLPLTCSL